MEHNNNTEIKHIPKIKPMVSELMESIWINDNGKNMCIMNGGYDSDYTFEQAQENANRICKALNNYPDAIEALKRVDKFFDKVKKDNDNTYESSMVLQVKEVIKNHETK